MAQAAVNALILIIIWVQTINVLFALAYPIAFGAHRLINARNVLIIHNISLKMEAVSNVQLLLRVAQSVATNLYAPSALLVISILTLPITVNLVPHYPIVSSVLHQLNVKIISLIPLHQNKAFVHLA